ncbi:MAG TPA: hypothetical protein VF905_04085 [Nitrospirota bacterium]
MTPRLTKKLKRTIQQRAIEGMIRSIMVLHPEFDRPCVVDTEIIIRPKGQVLSLRIAESYQIP